VPRDLVDESCSFLTLYVHLADHKADTLRGIVAAVEEFKAENDTADTKFLLAAGNAGIEAATNIVVEQASHRMLFWVYCAVIVLCLLNFSILARGSVRDHSADSHVYFV